MYVCKVNMALQTTHHTKLYNPHSQLTNLYHRFVSPSQPHDVGTIAVTRLACDTVESAVETIRVLYHTLFHSKLVFLTTYISL